MPPGAITSRDEDARVNSTLSKTSMLLAWVLVVFGILTVVFMAAIVYETYSPIIFWDQWTIVNDIIQSNGHPTLAQLWAPNNEHRIPFGRLTGYADLAFFGGRNVSLLIEIFVVQLLEAFLLIWMFHRYSGRPRPVFLTAAGFVTFCIFYPIQIENFVWGFQISFVLAMFAASSAIAAMVVHADLASSQTPSPWVTVSLLVSMAAALVSELSLASGIFVWPLLLLTAFGLRVPRKTYYLVAAVGAVAMAGFLWNFHPPGHHANPLQSLRHPLAILRYIRVYLAFTWDPAMPSGSDWPTFAESLVVLAVGITLVALLRLLIRRSPEDKLQTFFLMNMVFVLITAAVTGLGRVNFGISQATTSRYQTFALLFWACLVGMILLRLSDPKSFIPARLLEVQVVLILALTASGPRFESSRQAAKARQASLAQGYRELVRNPSNGEARRQLSPFSDLANAYEYLRSHNVGPDIRDYGGIQGAIEPVKPSGSLEPISPSETAQLKVKGFQVMPSTQCAGFVDAVEPVIGEANRVVAQGWAWNVASARRPSGIVLALADGTVAGKADVSMPRPDVKDQIPGVTSLDTGWRGEAYVPRGAALRAFAALDDSKLVCPLSNEFRQR